MVVFVHNKSLREPSLSEGIFIKPGEMSYINVKRKYISKYPAPYSQCMEPDSFSSYLYDFILASGSLYRQQDCTNLCIQEQIIKECDCFFLRYKNHFNASIEPCLNLTQAQCVIDQLNMLNINECVSKYCPLECQSYEYELSLSSATNPTLNYFLNLPQNYKDIYASILELNNQSFTYDVFKSIYISMNIYYSSLDVEQVSETPKVVLSDLFVQIGASLGIFISFSVFTFFEFVEILFRIVYLLVSERKHKEERFKGKNNQVENDEPPPV